MSVYTAIIKLDSMRSNMTAAETSATACLEIGLKKSAIKVEQAGAVPIDVQS